MSAHLVRTSMVGMLALLAIVSLSAAQTASAQPPTQPQSHAGHAAAQDTQQQKPPATGQEDHSAHQKPAAQKEYPAGIPPVTDADRKAAFPQLDDEGHAVHDSAVHYYVQFDQLEWQVGDGITAANWDNRGWVGRDVNRFWFRTEGEAEEGDLAEAQAHALYGRAIHRWWDVVVGVRQDFRPGPARTWAAIGLQGLAPYWFEVEATAYVGESGRTHFRFETEYELLLTNRLILQPLVELEIYGKDDPERGIGAGLSSGEAGLRVRYGFRREFAPYIGVTWNRKFFGTGDFARAAGDDTGGARFATGVRVWF
ncbi:MAG: copper resistance protein B [Vicinamibacterales bacterium]